MTLPWYSVRLRQWYALNQRFAELRHPNSFSAHGELADRFQTARYKLSFGAQLSGVVWIGTLVGLLWFALSRPQ